jgi:hypothetical protein
MRVSIVALSIIDDRKNLHLSMKAVNYIFQGIGYSQVNLFTTRIKSVKEKT